MEPVSRKSRRLEGRSGSHNGVWRGTLHKPRPLERVTRGLLLKKKGKQSVEQQHKTARMGNEGVLHPATGMGLPDHTPTDEWEEIICDGRGR